MNDDFTNLIQQNKTGVYQLPVFPSFEFLQSKPAEIQMTNGNFALTLTKYLVENISGTENEQN